jgi:4,5-dihydroxyphthalate decarboxylase
MADLRLSFAMTPWDRILPLINGEVKPDGITLDYMGMPGSFGRVFYEQIKFQRYDVSEMSMSSSLRMLPIRWPYRMLPVFHNRNFTYTKIYIRKSSGIRQGHPEDLKGKRFGIKDYQQSLGLWTRGILQAEFGIKPEDLIWYQERGEHLSHTGASGGAGLAFPKSVTLHYAKTDFNTMYLSGEMDASVDMHLNLGGISDTGLDRNGPSLSENPDIVTLFPDPRQEAIRYYRKTGIFPPHHATVVRESILKEHPWVAISLMEAFEESKRIAIERLRKLQPTLMVFGDHYLKDITDIFGPDPFVYGIKANAKAFDMVQTFSVQQGLTERKQPLDEIFPLEILPLEILYSEERLS